MKKYILSISIFLTSLISFSQEGISKNNIYVEFLGKGLFYSVNYERKVIQLNDLIGINLSGGLGVFPGLASIEKSTDLFIPIEMNFSFSKKNHHGVIGYGTTYWRYKINFIDIDNSNLTQQPITPTLENVNEWFAHVIMEYRYQKPSGGFLFKAGYCPLFFAKAENTTFNKNINYQTSINIGVGWSF